MKYLVSLWAGFQAVAIAVVGFGLAITALKAARVGPFGGSELVAASGSELLIVLVSLALIFAYRFRRELRRQSRRGSHS